MKITKNNFIKRFIKSSAKSLISSNTPAPDPGQDILSSIIMKERSSSIEQHACEGEPTPIIYKQHNSVVSKNLSEYKSQTFKTSFTTSVAKCLIIRDNNRKLEQDYKEVNRELISFRGKIDGFLPDEQPIFQISKLENLETQNLEKWINTFFHLKSNCEWNDQQATKILNSLVSPEIGLLFSNKRTFTSMIEELKAKVYPSDH